MAPGCSTAFEEPRSSASWSRGILEFLQLQLGWFACVLGAAEGMYWLGPAVVAILVSLYLLFLRISRQGVRSVALMIITLGFLGTLLDSGQSALGLLSFQGAATSWLSPLWISALWFHFGTAIPAFHRLLGERFVLAAALGAVAGPMAYGAGMRLGAANFHPEVWPSLLSTALVWSFALPVSLRLYQSLRRAL